MSEPQIWPTEIRLKPGGRLLVVAFDNGEVHELSAEMLRVMSPSAEVQGHSPAERVLVTGKQDVAIVRIDPVGNYAVRLAFDDRHATGIYSWDYLLTLGREKESRWAAYLDELRRRGISR